MKKNRLLALLLAGTLALGSLTAPVYANNTETSQETAVETTKETAVETVKETGVETVVETKIETVTQTTPEADNPTAKSKSFWQKYTVEIIGAVLIVGMLTAVYVTDKNKKNKSK